LSHRLYSRLAALRQRQAKPAALQDGRPGSAQGRSGSGSRYAVTYRYDGYDQLDEIINAGGDFVWKAESRDAFGPVSRLPPGHGVVADEILDWFARGTSMSSSVPGAPALQDLGTAGAPSESWQAERTPVRASSPRRSLATHWIARWQAPWEGDPPGTRSSPAAEASTPAHRTT
jgi:hypothetical protein